MRDKEALAWWLVGFIEGEGHFKARIDLQKGRYWVLSVGFQMAQRWDNRQALELGRTLLPYGKIRRYRSRPNPMAFWGISDTKGLLAVVDLCDQHPLQTKKAEDYAIWRELVLLKEGFYPGCQTSVFRVYEDRIRELVTRLKDGRIYREEAVSTTEDDLAETLS